MRRRAGGFTLIEALVALVVLLAGLAGAATLLLQTVRYERESATRRAILRHAASLADELRARRAPGGGSSGSAEAAIETWTAELESRLPAGGAVVVANDAALGAYRLSIEWPETGGGRQRLLLPVAP